MIITPILVLNPGQTTNTQAEAEIEATCLSTDLCSQLPNKVPSSPPTLLLFISNVTDA